MVVDMETLPVQLDTLITQVIDSQPEGDVLAYLDQACSTAVDLNEIGDHLIGHFVDQARTHGYSWTQIGQRIGVTKQAARKRFAPADVPEQPATEAASVFRRYTHLARRAIVAAQENAIHFQHDYIGTEHLLLGVCDIDAGLGAQVIAETSGLGIDEFRQRIVDRLAPASPKTPERVPFTPKAKKAVELATRQSLYLGDTWVDTEHLLLGILAENTGIAAEILRAADVTTEAVRARLRQSAGRA
jgi:hypothetical protein